MFQGVPRTAAWDLSGVRARRCRRRAGSRTRHARSVRVSVRREVPRAEASARALRSAGPRVRGAAQEQTVVARSPRTTWIRVTGRSTRSAPPEPRVRSRHATLRVVLLARRGRLTSDWVQIVAGSAELLPAGFKARWIAREDRLHSGARE